MIQKIKNLPYKLKVVLAIVFISLILLVPEISFGGLSGLSGYDMFFHMTRYLDDAMQIKTGHFSYFQQFFTNNNSGRIMNALYGPLFAYLQGFLMFISGFHGIVWYILYCWLINLVGLASMFYCLRTCSIQLKTSLLLSIFYVIAGNVNVQVTAGAYAIGYAFFPLIIAASLRLLRSDNRPVIVWELVLALTVLAQTHMMSLLLGLGVYFLAFLYFSFRKLKSKIYFPAIKFLILAAVLVLLLNFNIYGGYIEVVMSNPKLVMPNTPIWMIFPYTLDFSNVGFTQFPAFTALLLVACYLMTGKKFRSESPDMKFALIASILFSILAFGMINLSFIPKVALIQFYARFMVIALPLGLVLAGHLLSKSEGKSKKLFRFALPFALVFTLIPYFSSTTRQSSDFVQKSFSTFQNSIKSQDYFDAMLNPKTLLDSSFYKTRIVAATSGQVDYVPNGSPYIVTEAKGEGNQSYWTFQNYFVNDVYKQVHFAGTDLNRTVTSKGLEISWNSDKVQETMLPVLKYTHSKVVLNGKTLSDSEFGLSYVGALKVNTQAGKNTLFISYQPAKWFGYGIVVQLLSLLGVCIFILVRRVRHKQKV